MPPQTSRPASQPIEIATAVLEERLRAVSSDILEIKTEQQEIKTILSGLSANFEVFQRTYIEKHGDVKKDTERAHLRLDVVDKQIAAQASLISILATSIGALEKLVGPLVFASRITSGAAVVVGGSIVVLIFAILTHQVTLTFP
jgi:VIT1/CCC1 family predicted Fe2+/Mn2+ transporter